MCSWGLQRASSRIKGLLHSHPGTPHLTCVPFGDIQLPLPDLDPFLCCSLLPVCNSLHLFLLPFSKPQPISYEKPSPKTRASRGGGLSIFTEFLLAQAFISKMGIMHFEGCLEDDVRWCHHETLSAPLCALSRILQLRNDPPPNPEHSSSSSWQMRHLHWHLPTCSVPGLRV